MNLMLPTEMLSNLYGDELKNSRCLFRKRSGHQKMMLCFEETPGFVLIFEAISGLQFVLNEHDHKCTVHTFTPILRNSIVLNVRYNLLLLLRLVLLLRFFGSGSEVREHHIGNTPYYMFFKLH